MGPEETRRIIDLWLVTLLLGEELGYPLTTPSCYGAKMVESTLMQITDSVLYLRDKLT